MIIIKSYRFDVHQNQMDYGGSHIVKTSLNHFELRLCNINLLRLKIGLLCHQSSDFKANVTRKIEWGPTRKKTKKTISISGFYMGGLSFFGHKFPIILER